MVYIYVGEDPYYTYLECKRNIEKKYSENKDIDFYKFDGVLDEVSKVIDTCMTYSFFASKKVIIYDRCNFLSSSKDKQDAKKEKDIDSLIDFAMIEDYDVELNLIVTPSLQKSEKIKTLVQNSNLVSVQSLSEDDYFQFINKKVNSQNKNISTDACKEILVRCKSADGKFDYLQVQNNIDKLCLATDNITIDDVEALVYKPLEDKIFTISESLLNKNTAYALKVFRDLLSLGYQVYSILPVLYNSFWFLARVKYLAIQGKNIDEICSNMNEKSFYRVKYALKNIQYITYKNLNKILSDLGKEENNYKYENRDPEASLETFMCLFDKNYL